MLTVSRQFEPAFEPHPDGCSDGNTRCCHAASVEGRVGLLDLCGWIRPVGAGCQRAAVVLDINLDVEAALQSGVFHSKTLYSLSCRSGVSLLCHYL